MYIDCHLHTSYFPKPPRPNGLAFATPEDIMGMLKPHGVVKAAILPESNPEWSLSIQSVEDVLAICDKYPDFFYPFMNIDPRMVTNSPNSDLGYLIKYYKALGCRGIGEVTASLPFDDPYVENLFKHTQAHGLPLTFHIAPQAEGFYGLIDHLGLPLLEGALRKFPDLIFLGHSQPFWAEISGDVNEVTRNEYPKGPVVEGGAVVRLMRTYPNLWGDLSPAAGSGYNAISRDPEFGYAFLEEFQDRLMFGSDITAPNDTMDEVDFLNSAVAEGRISRDAFEKIAWENAASLFKLEV